LAAQQDADSGCGGGSPRAEFANCPKPFSS
jgi:hypothetical protein